MYKLGGSLVPWSLIVELFYNLYAYLSGRLIDTDMIKIKM